MTTIHINVRMQAKPGRLACELARRMLKLGPDVQALGGTSVVTVDSTDETFCFSIETFPDQAAMDADMKTPLVQALIADLDELMVHGSNFRIERMFAIPIEAATNSEKPNAGAHALAAMGAPAHACGHTATRRSPNCAGMPGSADVVGLVPLSFRRNMETPTLTMNKRSRGSPWWRRLPPPQPRDNETEPPGKHPHENSESSDPSRSRRVLSIATANMGTATPSPGGYPRCSHQGRSGEGVECGG